MSSQNSRLGKRIVVIVIGTTDSSKTTFARRIAEQLQLPHVKLDARNWGPNWTPAPLEIFHERVCQALTEEWLAAVENNSERMRLAKS
jgi:adenylate kinase family enzyme